MGQGWAKNTANPTSHSIEMVVEVFRGGQAALILYANRCCKASLDEAAQITDSSWMIDWEKQRKAAARERLLPPHEEAQILEQYGEIIKPVLEKLLDEKVAGLSKNFHDSWRKFGEYLTSETREIALQQLLSHAEAANMLGCSVSTIKRMVVDGTLPKPVRLSEHRIGHRLVDVKKLVRGSQT